MTDCPTCRVQQQPVPDDPATERPLKNPSNQSGGSLPVGSDLATALGIAVTNGVKPEILFKT